MQACSTIRPNYSSRKPQNALYRERVEHDVESERRKGQRERGQIRKAWARVLGLAYEALYRTPRVDGGLRRIGDDADWRTHTVRA